MWGWFLELAEARGGNGLGENPIGYSDIRSWSELTGRRPDPVEVALIRRLDGVMLGLKAESSKKKAS